MVYCCPDMIFIGKFNNILDTLKLDVIYDDAIWDDKTRIIKITLLISAISLIIAFTLIVKLNLDTLILVLFLLNMLFLKLFLKTHC